jgi:hypothetical protein
MSRKRRSNRKRDREQDPTQAALHPAPEISPAATTQVPTAKKRSGFWTRILPLGVLALGGVWGVIQILPGYWQGHSGQRQADVAQQSVDRGAGRLGVKVQVAALVPSAEQMKPLLAPMHPKLIDPRDQKPAEFIFFKDMHALCTVNPQLRLVNVGQEIVEAVSIEVEETSVMPVGAKEPPLVADPQRPGKPALLAYKPNINPTLRENCVLSEKVMPGDEVMVPVWRPLILAMMKAQRVKGNGDGDKYHGSFDVRCYVRGVGATGFDRTEGQPVRLAFTWSAHGFTDEMFKTIADNPARGTVLVLNRPGN